MSSPYMPLYVGDYLADTSHLNAEEHGAYMLLLMAYWQRQRSLPNDPVKLASIARVESQRWMQIEPTIREFFVVDKDQWKHKRIEQEIGKFKKKRAQAQEAGRASAEARKPPELTDAQRTFNGRSTEGPTKSQPPTPTPTLRIESNPTPITEAAREPNGVGERFDLRSVGVGLGGEPSIAARRDVCRDLGLTDAEPIVRAYMRWAKSKYARDPDAMFTAAAPKLFARLPASVRAQIYAGRDPPEITTLPPVKASSSLVASLRKH